MLEHSVETKGVGGRRVTVVRTSELATRSAVTSSETGKSFTITDPQFTLLENGYVTYFLGLNGTANGKGILIVKVL